MQTNASSKPTQTPPLATNAPREESNSPTPLSAKAPSQATPTPSTSKLSVMPSEQTSVLNQTLTDKAAAPEKTSSLSQPAAAPPFKKKRHSSSGRYNFSQAIRQQQAKKNAMHQTMQHAQQPKTQDLKRP